MKHLPLYLRPALALALITAAFVGVCLAVTWLERANQAIAAWNP